MEGIINYWGKIHYSVNGAKRTDRSYGGKNMYLPNFHHSQIVKFLNVKIKTLKIVAGNIRE